MLRSGHDTLDSSSTVSSCTRMLMCFNSTHFYLAYIARFITCHAAVWHAAALEAAEEALRSSNWLPTSDADRNATGVAIGSGIGSLEDIVDADRVTAARGPRRISPQFVPRILLNLAAGQVGVQWGLRGPNHCAATACATGAHAIGDAFRLIKFGEADVMLAGGTEASVNVLSLGGFGKMRALSTKFNSDPSEASRPFDAARDGFVIGGKALHSARMISLYEAFVILRSIYVAESLHIIVLVEYTQWY
jgi:3-oxoacyl-(acyl-carrier-protein) synthase